MSKILTIIPYEFYPPFGGGALRCFNILKEMAANHSIYLLTVQPAEDFLQSSATPFPENIKIVSFSKSTGYRSVFNVLPNRIANAINYRILNKSLTGNTDSSLLRVYPVLKILLNTVKFDIVYYENLEALSLLGKIIKSKSPTSIKIYDAHNVDSELWMQKAVLENSELCKTYSQKALKTETTLHKRVDFYFCCSEQDNSKLRSLNNNKITGLVIPNGMNLALNPFDSNFEKYQIKNIIFCGSLDYFPNREGLFWFYNEVFPIIKRELPNITLTVIGNVVSKDVYDFLLNDKSVKFIGNVQDVAPYYRNASVAIAPLKSGSGTRLKILEAMSLGNPVVSTTIGAEGIECENNINLFIGDHSASFASNVLKLLNNQAVFDSIRKNAYELVKSKYNWENIGLAINGKLNELLKLKWNKI